LKPRIHILGGSGSGKSYVAINLVKAYEFMAARGHKLIDCKTFGDAMAAAKGLGGT